MYLEFYNLQRYPFRLTPDPAFLYVTSQHREAFAGLIYSVCTNPGLTVLVGEAGTGKTTLLYTLLGLLEKRRCITAMCTNPTLTREEFYDLLLAKLGVVCASSLKSRQLIALQESLFRNRTDGRRAVLIVDEAQRLPTELLEEVRLLLNLETPTDKLLEIILAGQPELMDILGRPGLRQLKQRVSYFCKLNPLNLLELREYLQHRLARAGLPQQELFPQAAVEAIYEYTQGIPRLVNSLCDSALRAGFAAQSRQIPVPIIREAAKDINLGGFVFDDQLDQPKASRVARTPRGPVPAPEINAYGDHDGVPEVRVPLEDYANRQKSLGFLAGLMDRWKS